MYDSLIIPYYMLKFLIMWFGSSFIIIYLLTSLYHFIFYRKCDFYHCKKYLEIHSNIIGFYPGRHYKTFAKCTLHNKYYYYDPYTGVLEISKDEYEKQRLIEWR